MSAKKKTNWKARALQAEKMVETDREYREKGAQEIEKLLDMILPLQRKNRELMEAAEKQEARIAELEELLREEGAEADYWAEKAVETDREYREKGAQEIEKLLDTILPLQRKNRELMEAAGTQEARIAELEAQVRAERAEIEFWVEQSDNFRNQIVEMLRDEAWTAK